MKYFRENLKGTVKEITREDALSILKIGYFYWTLAQIEKHLSSKLLRTSVAKYWSE